MLDAIMESEKTVSLLNRIYRNSRERFGEENKEFTIPALAALRDAERVRDYLKEIQTFI